MIKIKQQGSGNKNIIETLYLTWKALFLLSLGKWRKAAKLSRRALPVETEPINAVTGAAGEDEGEDLGR